MAKPVTLTYSNWYAMISKLTPVILSCPLPRLHSCFLNASQDNWLLSKMSRSIHWHFSYILDYFFVLFIVQNEVTALKIQYSLLNIRFLKLVFKYVRLLSSCSAQIHRYRILWYFTLIDICCFWDFFADILWWWLLLFWKRTNLC